MRTLPLVVLGVLAATPAGPLGAQRDSGPHAGLQAVEQLPLASVLPGSASQAESTTRSAHNVDLALPDSAVHQHSYWLTGMIVGAAVGLVGGLQLQHEICGDSDANRCTGADHVSFLIPVTVFGVVGGLIGSSIHRQ